MNLIKKLWSKLKGDKNNREITLNIVYTFLIKGGAMLISVLIVPAYVRYFNNDTAYGAWITIASVFTWMTLFDLGIGNGLRNYLVKSIADKDENASKRYISSAYMSVGLIAVFFGVVGALIISSLDWNILLKVPSHIVRLSVLRLYIQIVYFGVVIHFFFMLISSIYYALQKTFMPSLFTMVTQLILLIFLYVPNKADLETKIIVLSVMYFLAYNVPILTASLILFTGRLKYVRPSTKYFDLDTTKHIIGLGGAFFLIQLALIALHSSNELYINLFFNAEDVVQYQYYYRIFYILFVAMTLVTQPIWSAITKAYCEKRYAWISRAYLFINCVALLLSLFSVLLALMYQPLDDLWLGKGILHVQSNILGLFCAYTSMFLVSNVSNVFANGLGKLKCQTICTVAGAAIKLTIIILIKNMFDVQWETVMLANVIAMLPLFIAQPIYVYSYIRKLRRQEVVNNKPIRRNRNVAF